VPTAGLIGHKSTRIQVNPDTTLNLTLTILETSLLRGNLICRERVDLRRTLYPDAIRFQFSAQKQPPATNSIVAFTRFSRTTPANVIKYEPSLDGGDNDCACIVDPTALKASQSCTNSRRKTVIKLIISF